MLAEYVIEKTAGVLTDTAIGVGVGSALGAGTGLLSHRFFKRRAELKGVQISPEDYSQDKKRRLIGGALSGAIFGGVSGALMGRDKAQLKQIREDIKKESDRYWKLIHEEDLHAAARAEKRRIDGIMDALRSNVKKHMDLKKQIPSSYTVING